LSDLSAAFTSDRYVTSMPVIPGMTVGQKEKTITNGPIERSVQFMVLNKSIERLSPVATFGWNCETDVPEMNDCRPSMLRASTSLFGIKIHSILRIPGAKPSRLPIPA
jgi:hypothetical protein